MHLNANTHTHACTYRNYWEKQDWLSFISPLSNCFCHCQPVPKAAVGSHSHGWLPNPVCSDCLHCLLFAATKWCWMDFFQLQSLEHLCQETQKSLFILPKWCRSRKTWFRTGVGVPSTLLQPQGFVIWGCLLKILCKQRDRECWYERMKSLFSCFPMLWQ